MGTGYEISVPEVLKVVAGLDGLLSQFRAGTRDAGGVTLPAAAYGHIGGAAATSSASAQQQLVVALEAVAVVLQKLNERVAASAEGYAGHDDRIAGTLHRMAAGEHHR
ncbi:hypothetical protein Asp14428_13010 [Actinoplanes sp. NBRC 14428]|uniref:Excreted virulence factor EspC (Type VII ESX diderm) n=1 Tax=Pseudosporangium ferrugineum TaxID=439699 RepID=A0A2T0SEU2_9ACTN|nr:type VII secretion target [Pseudosporangium ferrugineum]PRY31936.1 excreted virulence factor EspC (type VII ESX diderm) [Pseudosporangium ferrugineum]BCJ49826.1 hypothetical protein Asp14428_13010 [Actinoplanes sp. NBRC 14428]